VNNEKSFGALLAEAKQELKEFAVTRIGILKAEIDEKISTWKYAVPLLFLAIALLLAAWMTLTFALIALLHALFVPSNYSWLWASLIVGGAYLLLGVAIGWFAYGEIKALGFRPNRTIGVLKQDQIWLQNEVRTV